MPNHVTHRVAITGDVGEIKRFRETCFTLEEGEPCFDFEKIIPMPEILKGSESSSSVDHWLFAMGHDFASFGYITNPLTYPWVQNLGITTREQWREYCEKTWPEGKVAAERAIKAKEETGCVSWYDWRIRHWGTKWGAYSFDFLEEGAERIEFKFDTAWSVPEPIFAKLATMFPTLEVKFTAFDEGWNFAVEGKIEDGSAFIKEVEATKELYEHVYGEPYESDEDEEGEN